MGPPSQPRSQGIANALIKVENFIKELQDFAVIHGLPGSMVHQDYQNLLSEAWAVYREISNLPPQITSLSNAPNQLNTRLNSLSSKFISIKTNWTKWK